MPTDVPRTMPQLLAFRVAATPDKPALMHPDGSSWKTLTWKDTGERVRAIACGLRALGLADEQRCSILSSTRYEWILADLGIMCGGGATTTIYPSNTPDECAFILKDSTSVFVFAEGNEQVAKLAQKRGELPNIKKVITFDGNATPDGWVITFADLEKTGREHAAAHPGLYEKVSGVVKPESLATLIYTSGTTGQPKGVELTHDCWVYEGEAIDALKIVDTEDVQYFWLPLAHSFGKVLESAQIRLGFVTAVDGRQDKLVDNLAVIKPTFVAAVPRVFEKVYNKVVQGTKEAGGLKWVIFQWAFGVGHRVSALRQRGDRPSALLALQNLIAHKLVFSKLKARFGGRLRFFISGGAPLSREIAEFFHAADILIIEGYGLTETSAFSFVNRPDAYKFGTVGPAAPGTEVKIAEDGEVLIKGRGVMRGYHGLAQATAETIDAQGWLRTGDIGMLDGKHLKITDRKKDLIKTSGGKYVAPQALEGKFKLVCPYVSQIVVHGDNRNFCSALIALDEESIKKWANDNGLTGLTYSQLTGNPRVKELVEKCVQEMNAQLPSYETIKKFAILPHDLTEAGGDLTASQKLKRRAVEKKYSALLDEFYKESVAGM